MLNVVMLNVVMLNVIMLNVVMLNVIMLNVVMLSVVAPLTRVAVIFSHFFIALAAALENLQKKNKLLNLRSSHRGAATVRIMTLGIMTQSILTLGIITLSMMAKWRHSSYAEYHPFTLMFRVIMLSFACLVLLY